MLNKINLSVAAASLALCTGAQAETFVFSADISGDQEVPSADTPALGFLAGVYDSDDQSFSFQWLITDNLVGNPAAPGAHIHNAPAGSNGPIVFGFATDTWDLSGSAVWENMSQGDIDELFAGNMYVNFHTDAFPGGEVRGQITQVLPAPGVLGLAGMGLMVGARRRRG